MLGSRVPIMQAPLGRAGGVQLALAVSQAGGLGTLGASWATPEDLREQIRILRRSTEGPFCVNLVLDFEQEARFEVVAEEGVPLVSFSWGINPEFIERAHAGGTRVLVQVASASGPVLLGRQVPRSDVAGMPPPVSTHDLAEPGARTLRRPMLARDSPIRRSRRAADRSE